MEGSIAIHESNAPTNQGITEPTNSSHIERIDEKGFLEKRPAAEGPQTNDSAVFDFNDVELLEIDDENRVDSGEQTLSPNPKHDLDKPDSNEAKETDLVLSGCLPIPIIIQTNNFPYLLAPIGNEQHSALPSEYEHVVTLLDEPPMPGSTLHEVFECIKETFKNLDNPFDEKDELIVTFKEFDISLPDTCVHAHEVLLSEIYEAFAALKKFKGREAPACLTLQLKPQRAFITRLDELRKLNGETDGEFSDVSDALLDLGESESEEAAVSMMEEAKEESKCAKEEIISVPVPLTAEDIKDLDDSMESDVDLVSKSLDLVSSRKSPLSDPQQENVSLYVDEVPYAVPSGEVKLRTEELPVFPEDAHKQDEAETSETSEETKKSIIPLTGKLKNFIPTVAEEKKYIEKLHDETEDSGMEFVTVAEITETGTTVIDTSSGDQDVHEISQSDANEAVAESNEAKLGSEMLMDELLNDELPATTPVKHSLEEDKNEEPEAKRIKED